MKTSTKIAAFLLSFIPGLGQILTGRHLRGMVLFFSFLMLIDLALIILPCVWGKVLISKWLIICAGVIWGYNMVDIIRIIYWRERVSLVGRKKPLFQEGLTLYLQGDFMGAVQKFRQILKLDRDDPDVFFWLGMISKRQNKLKKARKYFSHCLVLDETEKWQWEVAQEIKGIK